jgi:hypothetical protein
MNLYEVLDCVYNYNLRICITEIYMYTLGIYLHFNNDENKTKNATMRGFERANRCSRAGHFDRRAIFLVSHSAIL